MMRDAAVELISHVEKGYRGNWRRRHNSRESKRKMPSAPFHFLSGSSLTRIWVDRWFECTPRWLASNCKANTQNQSQLWARYNCQWKHACGGQIQTARRTARADIRTRDVLIVRQTARLAVLPFCLPVNSTASQKNKPIFCKLGSVWPYKGNKSSAHIRSTFCSLIVFESVEK